MSFGKFSFFRRSYPATLSATKRPHCCRGSLLGSLMHIKAATYDDVMEDKSRIYGKHTAALWLDVPGWGLWITTKASWGSCLEHCPASLSLWSLGLWSCPMSGLNKNPRSFSQTASGLSPISPLVQWMVSRLGVLKGNPIHGMFEIILLSNMCFFHLGQI